MDNNKSRKDPVPLKKERDQGNRPDFYKRMGVSGEPIFHPSYLSKVPGRVIERRTVQVFNLKTCLVEERFEMVHYAAPGEKQKCKHSKKRLSREIPTFVANKILNQDV